MTKELLESETEQTENEQTESREEQIERLGGQLEAMKDTLENMKSREFWEPVLKKPFENLAQAIQDLESELEKLKK